MAVKQYSLKKYGRDYKLSEHFTLGEMACKGGSDTVLVSEELIAMLEKLRAYGGFTIHINSGYRTEKYNRSVNGVDGSKHCEGLAADCVVYKDGKRQDPKVISCLAQTLGFKGIGRMNTAVHLDMANRIYRGDELKDYSNNVNGDFYKYFGIAKSTIEKMKVKEKPNIMANVSEWAKKSWQWCYDNGILDGTNPKDGITREQVACVAERLYKKIKAEEK